MQSHTHYICLTFSSKKAPEEDGKGEGADKDENHADDTYHAIRIMFILLIMMIILIILIILILLILMITLAC